MEAAKPPCYDGRSHEILEKSEVDHGPKCICEQDIPKGRESEVCEWPLKHNPACPVHANSKTKETK